MIIRHCQKKTYSTFFTLQKSNANSSNKYKEACSYKIIYIIENIYIYYVIIRLRALELSSVAKHNCNFFLSGWSPEGCQVEWSNSTHTGCACSHLTNFAVLMDVRGVPLSRGHETALRLITLVGCAVSAVALAAAVAVFQCCRNMKVRTNA